MPAPRKYPDELGARAIRLVRDLVEDEGRGCVGDRGVPACRRPVGDQHRHAEELGCATSTARFAFLDPQANEFFRDWDRVANDTVALLRAEAGRNPYDRGLSDLIGELSTRSDDFRVRWAAHNVRIHSTGVKLVHHPVVGDVDLSFESFPLAGDPSQAMVTFTAEPGSPSQDALTLLASWAATSGSAEHLPSTDDPEHAASIEKTD